jgi:hypothetical protein
MKRVIFAIIILLFAFNAQAQKKVPKTIEERYVSGMFRDNDALSFVPSEDIAATSSLNVFQYLQGKVAGLQIYGNPFSPYIRYRFGRPALFVNEIRVDADYLSSIPMSDVALVRVHRPPFIGAFGGGNGAIAVYTKTGEEE